MVKGEKAANKTTMNDIVTFMGKGTGKKYMDQLRVVIGEFINAEASLLEVRSKDAHDTANLAKTSMVQMQTLRRSRGQSPSLSQHIPLPLWEGLGEGWGGLMKANNH
ncbi:hypothetical protein MBAV_004093 [Candidatus Magnetobacterium bavaricum]|uniref:Uncharacterized protein n=1 Tax=Candidatus Magnetobacterium bavaricum TaxID=29290 RepID=A0A0F3GP04_9BACT|nr:hypothetical protein MBAV_004093 [Candidatus Magnetobacterium bavaricum]